MWKSGEHKLLRKNITQCQKQQVSEYGDQRPCDLSRKRLFKTLLKAVLVKGMGIQDCGGDKELKVIVLPGMYNEFRNVALVGEAGGDGTPDHA